MAGWNDWVPGANMTLSQVLDAFKSATIGLDVKDKMYWSFFKIVEQAIRGGNSNFDVEMAKGPYRDLKTRLDAMDADTRNFNINWINKNLGKLDQTFMTDEFLQQMAGTTPINAVPADGSLTTPKYANNSVTREKVTSEIAIKPKVANSVKNPKTISASDWLTQLSNITVSGETITMTPTARFGQVYQEFAAKAGHKYYVKMDVSTTSNQVQLGAYRDAAGTFFKNAIGTGSFEKLSFIFESPVNTGLYPYRFRVLDSRASGWTPTLAKRPVWVDLTEAFGSGSEPTVEEFERMLTDTHGEIFFQGVEVLDYIIAKGIFPLGGASGAKPLYINYSDDILNVATKYSEFEDLRFELKRKGPNTLFDFSRIFKVINNTQEVDKSSTGGSLFYTNSSDWFGPYRVKAIGNINGDSIGTDYFTGGNHGYDNTGASGSTARNTSLKVFVEGRKVNNFSGFANFIEVRWTNRVQANNTTKNNGTGREVLEERYSLIFDGMTWRVKSEIEPLENISVNAYYGLQSQIGNWNARMRFEGADNRAWIEDVTEYHTSQSLSSNAIILSGTAGDTLEIGMDKSVDLGKLGFNDSTFDSFLSNSKAYWNLIRGDQLLSAGSVYTFSGYYRFYKE